jgi:hypothetical protein
LLPVLRGKLKSKVPRNDQAALFVAGVALFASMKAVPVSRNYRIIIRSYRYRSTGRSGSKSRGGGCSGGRGRGRGGSRDRGSGEKRRVPSNMNRDVFGSIITGIVVGGDWDTRMSESTNHREGKTAEPTLHG